MKLSKNIEIVIYEEKIIPFKIGHHIGTVYTTAIHDLYKLKLYNVGYCPSTKEFYYNRNIRLPRALINHFEDRNGPYKRLIREMEELGIYNKNDVDRLLDEYNDAVAQTEIIKEKTLSLQRSLKMQKQKPE